MPTLPPAAKRLVEPGALVATKCEKELLTPLKLLETTTKLFETVFKLTMIRELVTAVFEDRVERLTMLACQLETTSFWRFRSTLNSLEHHAKLELILPPAVFHGSPTVMAAGLLAVYGALVQRLGMLNRALLTVMLVCRVVRSMVWSWP